MPEFRPHPTSAPDHPADAGPGHAAPPGAAPGSARRIPRWWLALGAGVVVLLLGVAAAFAMAPDERQAADVGTPGVVASAPAGTPSVDGAPGVPVATEGVEATRPPVAPGSCAYPPDDAGGPDQRLVPAPPAKPAYTGPVAATVQTNLGALTLELDGTKAPCAVNAMVSLVKENYYTETDCHRVTTDGLWVVQCGDPTGTGSGTPGFKYDDENLPPPDGLWTYPRGTIAMANAGPDTNGSQFFIVYRDSELGPDYPVVGRVTAGIELVDKVAAGGTEDKSADGRPAQPLHITKVTIG
ncbi:MAG TPA: peptidylprolyl isomerase [Micromonosporaceae bacterium]|nr:peptidylprolyl isomerase [Micromonosporaceae bacterium]